MQVWGGNSAVRVGGRGLEVCGQDFSNSCGCGQRISTSAGLYFV